MDRNFQRALPVVLQYEGGWADNPKDPGGATMKGVTLATFRHRHPNATKADLRAISNDDLASIYREGFWKPVNGDGLASGVDLVTFDASVNSGPGRALGWLKASIGGSDVETIKRLCAKRLGFMHGLKIWKTFGKGWAARVASVEAKGVAWATSAVTNAHVTKGVLQREGEAAAKKAANQTKGAGGVAVAGGGSGHFTGSLVIFLAIAAVIAGALIYRAYINRERAKAYAAEAAGVSP
jgi:lysozyme family protein